MTDKNDTKYHYKNKLISDATSYTQSCHTICHTKYWLQLLLLQTLFILFKVERWQLCCLCSWCKKTKWWCLIFTPKIIVQPHSSQPTPKTFTFCSLIFQTTNRTRTMVKSECVDLRIWQQVKDGCRCGGHPHFTHRAQPCLWTNKRCIDAH